jgi:hypothetical protein
MCCNDDISYDIAIELRNNLRDKPFYKFASGVEDTHYVSIFCSDFEKNYIRKFTYLIY